MAEKTIVMDSPKPGTGSLRRVDTLRAIPKQIGPFEILSVLGKGGMGMVYLAYDPLLNREVALKLLTHSDSTKIAEESARLLSEAMLTGRLDSAGIIPIYSVDYDPAHGFYYTMRYLQGRTLQDILKSLQAGDEATREAFPQRRLLGIYQRACEAVAFAHRNRVIHRDLKPGNIMITDFGDVYVVDWGLAKDIDPQYVASTSLRKPGSADRFAECMKTHLNITRDFLAREQGAPPRLQGASRPLESAAYPEHLTDAHQIVGTPAYLSPEQVLRDTALAPTSDVFSLGVILYEMLTGHLPIDSVELFDMFQKLTSGAIVPIRSRAEAYRIPKVLCDIAERALALKPAARFHDAGELHRELTEYLEGRPPLKPVFADSLQSAELQPGWIHNGSEPTVHPDGVVLKDGQSLLCRAHALGDFRCTLQVQSLSRSHSWCYAICIGEMSEGGPYRPRYEVRLGIAGRASVELIRDGLRVQRRLDIRLMRGQLHRLRVELAGEVLRVFLDDAKLIDYRELFPQAGGAVAVASRTGEIKVREFDLSSRGAPLNLSSLALPDQLFRAKQFSEARDLYRKLAESHPDREEGLVASYKAGLCSVELKDLQSAFGEFARLEETAFDHCCALGLARIGSVDGNIDWAWEALKQGFRRHRAHEIGAEMWLALLELIGSLGERKTEEKLKRYHELLQDLVPANPEAGQLTVDLLEAAFAGGGLARLRREAAGLLKTYTFLPQLQVECVLALWRSGISLEVLPVVEQTLKAPPAKDAGPLLPPTRHALLSVELLLARGHISGARERLEVAAAEAADNSSDSDWIRDWQLLTQLLEQDYAALYATGRAAIDLATGAGAGPLSYVRLLSTHALLGCNHPERARSELRALASVIDLWGLSARTIVGRVGAEAFLKSAERHNAVQVIEALFLIAESHRLAGEVELAREYLNACLHHPSDRAMIRRLAEGRQYELSVRS